MVVLRDDIKVLVPTVLSLYAMYIQNVHVQWSYNVLHNIRCSDGHNRIILDCIRVYRGEQPVLRQTSVRWYLQLPEQSVYGQPSLHDCDGKIIRAALDIMM